MRDCAWSGGGEPDRLLARPAVAVDQEGVRRAGLDGWYDCTLHVRSEGVPFVSVLVHEACTPTNAYLPAVP